MINLLTQPMRIAQILMRAGCDQEFVGVVGRWLEGLVGKMLEVAKPTFLTNRQARVGIPPGAVCGERRKLREAILLGKVLDPVLPEASPRSSSSASAVAAW